MNRILDAILYTEVNKMFEFKNKIKTFEFSLQTHVRNGTEVTSVVLCWPKLFRLETAVFKN